MLRLQRSTSLKLGLNKRTCLSHAYSPFPGQPTFIQWLLWVTKVWLFHLSFGQSWRVANPYRSPKNYLSFVKFKLPSCSTSAAGQFCFSSPLLVSFLSIFPARKSLAWNLLSGDLPLDNSKMSSFFSDSEILDRNTLVDVSSRMVWFILWGWFHRGVTEQGRLSLNVGGNMQRASVLD